MTNPNPNYRKNIKPGLTVPTGLGPELEKFLHSIKEHLQGADGTRGQPKERFVTLEDLERIGLIRVGVKNGRGVILESNAATADDSDTATTRLNDLVDVDTSGVQDGYILVFSSALNRWLVEELEDPGDRFAPQLAWIGVR